jgi:hypothetical protein
MHHNGRARINQKRAATRHFEVKLLQLPDESLKSTAGE